MKKIFTIEEARDIGAKIGANFMLVDINQFRRGLHVELEHGSVSPETNVTNDDLLMTGKIAWAHLREMSDYYTQLARVERAAGVH